MKEIIIFTDGASKGNPGPGGWGAIVVSERVSELGGGEQHTTNNRMEMTAVIEALTHVFKNFKINKEFDSPSLGRRERVNSLTRSSLAELKDQKIIIYLDSSYVLKGATKWVRGWQENGWITKGKSEVQNKDLWEKFAKLLAQKESDNIEWKLLSGHVGIAGNERADEIATDFAAGVQPKLFSGSLEDYEKEHKIDILNIDHDVLKKAAKKKSSSRSKVQAYSYISMVKGVIKTHATWAECEARVKGVSGTRFKKATSAEEEKEIIAEWSAK